ncbi:MAG: hypothetical protein OEX12_14970 [Gammaproteobacteria bacterium]|nr:hypothetical protein [Gammaproteobacteria bacterium]
MHAPRLIFHPKDPQQIIAHDLLQQSMWEIGFIAEKLSGHADNSYAAGEHFIELLSFLGCSPVIKMSPQDGDNYCYIEWIDRPVAELICGSQPFQPRCNKCRQLLSDWQTQLNNGSSIQCHECDSQMALEQVNWKQSAGYASQFLIVHNIYLHEAVPGERLLMTLQKLSGNKEWSYFYAI